MDNDGPALLVDIRNSLYRAIYSSKKEEERSKISGSTYVVNYHYFTIVLRQMVNWMNVIRPSSVHIFWDAPRNTVWRRAVLKTYKDRGKGSSYVDISAELNETSMIAEEFFRHMNVRQYDRRQMEADDMIFAATTVIHPNPTVIVSTDSDMIQIPFSFDSSKVYNPVKKEITTVPEVSPVWQKALCGDKADSIEGYYNIGPKKSAIMLEGHDKLRKFLDENDAKVFYRNLLLIDLSLCPRLLKNKIYVQKRLAEPVTFCTTTINKLIMKYKVQGLLQEFANLIPPFQKLL